MRPEIASKRLWSLAGIGIVAPVTFPAAGLEGLNGDDVDPAVVPLLGRVPGALFAARYDTNSELPYNELGVGILARSRSGGLGIYCSHLWVDSEESLEAGRELWGLPKRMARFDWQTQGSAWSLVVTAENSVLLSLNFEVRRVGWSVPVTGRCFSYLPSGQLARWFVRSRSAIGSTAVTFDVPAGSPLAALRIGSRARGFFLDPLHLVISVPRPLSPH